MSGGGNPGSTGHSVRRSVTDRSRSRGRTVRRVQHVHTPPGPRTVAVDVVVLLALSVVAASPLAEAYGGWRWALAVGGGVLGGAGATLVARRLGWGAWPTVLMGVAWYFVAGAALAQPRSATAGVLPGPDALRGLATGVVRGWRESLTAVPPLGSSGTVLVVPLVLGLLTGVVAGALLWRSRHPAVVGLVLVVLLGVAASFGDRISPPEVARGVVLTAAVLVWIQLRAVRGLRISWWRRVGGIVAVLALAASVATGLHAVTSEPVARAVLRDHVEPPFDPLDYASPLSRYRAFTKDLEQTPLFTVTGVPADVPVRLATLDRYDGVVWNVGGDGESGRFRRVRPPIGDPAGGEVVVRIDDYQGVWVPSLGVTRSATDAEGDAGATGVVGNDSGTLAQLGGVRPGATYRLDAVRDVRPADPEITAAGAGPSVLVPPTGVPETLMKRVQAWIDASGSTTAGGDALAVTNALHDEGYYSDGLEGDVRSPSGHGTNRVGLLTGRTEMIGNDEQYASAMAMAMQQLGTPARVVLGFVATDGVPVTGGDVTAWVEVDLAGLGWVSFDPTPPKDQQPPDQQQDPEPLPQPQVLQPAEPPEEPDDLEQEPPQGAGTAAQPPRESAAAVIVESLAWVAKGLALTLPVWLLPLAKIVRRRRRRRRADPVGRVSGGWREVADRARDLGARLPAGSTRMESGTTMSARYPSASTLALAAEADRHVFGLGEPTADEVEDYWRDVRTALRRMGRDAPWWRRLLSSFSLASVPWRQGLRSLRRGAARRLHRLADPVRRAVTRAARVASVRRNRRNP